MDVAARQSTVGWEAASAAVSAAAAHAASVGACVNAAVVDRAGQLVSFLRMPGAPLHSVDIAIDKAYTAASFGLPTGDWAAALSSHSDAVRQGLPLRPRMVMFGGGLPLVVAGERIGGIGISGGSETQDEDCARAALAALSLTPAR
ncbi:GlcG/HbpS family heme-binding protein [Methyloversatilis discipulorum]|uniref:GlcG/HbpS family heme-binding protein n=1 Tax=Methyloversatilis discipulorum TaxID=1119528 RepID=UPI003AF6DFF6